MFGQWLENMMVKHHITTKDIAKATQSHQNLVRNWIRNKNKPSLKKFVMLVSHLEKLGEDPASICLHIVRLIQNE